MLERFDPQQFQSLFQDSTGKVGQGQARGSLRGCCLQHRAVLVEACKQARELVQIVSEEGRPIILGDGFQHATEAQQMLSEGNLVNRREMDRSAGFGLRTRL